MSFPIRRHLQPWPSFGALWARCSLPRASSLDPIGHHGFSKRVLPLTSQNVRKKEPPGGRRRAFLRRYGYVATDLWTLTFLGNRGCSKGPTKKFNTFCRGVNSSQGALSVAPFPAAALNTHRVICPDPKSLNTHALTSFDVGPPLL